MAWYTDFFVASADEIARMRFPADLEGRPVVPYKNISPDMLADLDFAVTGSTDREPQCVRDNEIVVYMLPVPLVTALAELTDQRLPEVADEWGGLLPDDAEALLTELRDLARHALAFGQDLYLYM